MDLDASNRALLLFCKGMYTEALVDILRKIDPDINVDVRIGSPARPVDLVSGQEPNLVLVDLDLSSPVDFEDIRTLKDQLWSANLIAFGTEESAHVIEGCYAAGAVGYVPKSFSRLATSAVLKLALKVPEKGAEYESPACAGDSPSVGRIAGPSTTSLEFGLTDREAEVLALAALGKSNAAIAAALGTAEGTVRIQMSSIFSKLNVSNRNEAIIVALRMDRIVREQIRIAESGTLDLAWLLPHMEHRSYKAGHVLFRKDDIGKEFFYLQGGSVVFPELGHRLQAKEVFGELGLFSPNHKRTSSAVCETDVDLFVLSEEKAKRMYYLSPAFAFYVVRVMAQRLVLDRQKSA